MVKGSLFWANGKGKLGQMVISRRGGEEITRAYQPNVKNPKSSRQMIQRAKFANAVKFFKHATENFFPFSFEDKKKNESYFNAFMRYNVNAAVVTSKNQTESKYPALGAEWTLTKGRLSPLKYGMVSSLNEKNVEYDQATLYMPNDKGLQGLVTVADYTKAFLAAYPDLKDGDIITFVLVSSKAKTAEENPSDLETARWTINQFTLNSKDSETKLDFLASHAHDITWGDKIYGICGCAVIASRNLDDNQVLVSTSTLVNGYITIQAINQLSSYPLFGENLKSWGAKDSDAILKGDLSINTNASFSGVAINAGNEGVLSVGSTFTVSQGANPSELYIYGSNLQNVKTEDLIIEGNGRWNTFMYDPGRIFITFEQESQSETWDITFKIKGQVIAKIQGNTGA